MTFFGGFGKIPWSYVATTRFFTTLEESMELILVFTAFLNELMAAKKFTAAHEVIRAYREGLTPEELELNDGMLFYFQSCLYYSEEKKGLALSEIILALDHVSERVNCSNPAIVTAAMNNATTAITFLGQTTLVLPEDIAKKCCTALTKRADWGQPRGYVLYSILRAQANLLDDAVGACTLAITSAVETKKIAPSILNICSALPKKALLLLNFADLLNYIKERSYEKSVGVDVLTGLASYLAILVIQTEKRDLFQDYILFLENDLASGPAFIAGLQICGIDAADDDLDHAAQFLYEFLAKQNPKNIVTTAQLLAQQVLLPYYNHNIPKQLLSVVWKNCDNGKSHTFEELLSTPLQRVIAFTLG